MQPMNAGTPLNHSGTPARHAATTMKCTTTANTSHIQSQFQGNDLMDAWTH